MGCRPMGNLKGAKRYFIYFHCYCNPRTVPLREEAEEEEVGDEAADDQETLVTR